MTIERAITIIFICDGSRDGKPCGRELATNAYDFQEALHERKAAGWSSRQMSDGGWNHYCEDCTERRAWQ